MIQEIEQGNDEGNFSSLIKSKLMIEKSTDMLP